MILVINITVYDFFKIIIKIKKLKKKKKIGTQLNPTHGARNLVLILWIKTSTQSNPCSS